LSRQAGWISEEHPEGMFEHVGRINVYTTIGCIQNVQVFNRRCLSGECSIQYDGHNDDLFISSSSTACGNEIGWEYVDQVMASRQTFTRFCKTMESKYKRSKNSALFLSLKVFIKWWFAWASSMKIDFRKQCQMCNEHMEYSEQSLPKVFLVLASDCSLHVIFPRNLITPMKELRQ